MNTREVIQAIEASQKERFIVISGTPMDGFCYHGPFDTRDAATEYAENSWKNVDWWVVKLEQPRNT